MQSGSTPQTQDYFANVNTPDPQDMQLQLEQLVQQGTLSPEEAQTIMQDPSAMNGISTDPNLKKNQMDALLGLQDISNSGGMTDMDKANLSQIKSDEDTATRGKRDAILQHAQERGMGGSGLELLDQLQNEQDSATRSSQRDLSVAGQAQQRALEALMQQGTLSGQIQNQDFNQKSQVAQANDAISKFNAQNAQTQVNQNVAANNAAQGQNLQATQQIANANTALANQQQQYNKNLQQQDFNNQVTKAGGQTGVAQTNAANEGKDSQNQANAENQMFSTLVGAGAAAYGAKKKHGGLIEGMPTNDDSVLTPTQPGELVVKKEDVPGFLMKAHTDKNGKFDAAGFLDTITGGKYGYKKGKV